MNCWSTTRALSPAKRRYSSKMEMSDQRWARRTHPTTQPVRCLPWLQWMSTGWWDRSSTTASAVRITGSGISSKGSLLPAAGAAAHPHQPRAPCMPWTEGGQAYGPAWRRTGHAKVAQRDALLLQEAQVCLWVLFRAEVHHLRAQCQGAMRRAKFSRYPAAPGRRVAHRTQAELLKKAEIFLDRKGRAVDAGPYHREVGRRLLLPRLGGLHSADGADGGGPVQRSHIYFE